MNKVILSGRLTKDPELKVTPSGTEVVNFSIAVNRPYQKSGAEKQVDFINCIAFKNTANFINKYFKKGQLIGLEGSIQIRTWEGQDGKKNYMTEVVVNSAEFLGNMKNDNSEEPKEKSANTMGSSELEDFINSSADLPF